MSEKRKIEELLLKVQNLEKEITKITSKFDNFKKYKMILYNRIIKKNHSRPPF
jgi:hypothetical protein